MKVNVKILFNTLVTVSLLLSISIMRFLRKQLPRLCLSYRKLVFITAWRIAYNLRALRNRWKKVASTLSGKSCMHRLKMFMSLSKLLAGIEKNLFEKVFTPECFVNKYHKYVYHFRKIIIFLENTLLRLFKQKLLPTTGWIAFKNVKTKQLNASHSCSNNNRLFVYGPCKTWTIDKPFCFYPRKGSQGHATKISPYKFLCCSATQTILWTNNKTPKSLFLITNSLQLYNPWPYVTDAVSFPVDLWVQVGKRRVYTHR